MQAARRIAVAAAVVLVAAGCGAKDEPAYSIKGTVLDVWDKPLRGVEVAASDGKRATTGADGAFTLVYGTTRPSALAFSKPGWAVFERPIAPNDRPSHLTIGPVHLVPAPEPTLGDLFVVGADRLIGADKRPLETLPVTITPGGAPGEQLYRITGSFSEVPAGKLRVVTTGALAKLRPRMVHEQAPESFLVASSSAPLTPRPLKVAGGGDMVLHESAGTLVPGRYLLVVDPGNADGTVPEPTEGYPILVK
jgi:hypothetical protein